HIIREELKTIQQTKDSISVIEFDNLKIDIGRREIRVDDIVKNLKPKEFDLLYYLVKHKNQVLTRDHILESVWGWEYIGDSRTVDVHVRWIREKIENDPSTPQKIITVRGTGYRFEG